VSLPRNPTVSQLLDEYREHVIQNQAIKKQQQPDQANASSAEDE
jgi:hypothetical protein